jgi:hypothetical protein
MEEESKRNATEYVESKTIVTTQKEDLKPGLKSEILTRENTREKWLSPRK